MTRLGRSMPELEDNLSSPKSPHNNRQPVKCHKYQSINGTRFTLGVIFHDAA